MKGTDVTEHDTINRSLFDLATQVNSIVGERSMCLQSVYVLVQAARARGIALQPIATSLFALDHETGDSVTFGSKGHEMIERMDPGHRWEPDPLFPQGHMVARCEETGWIVDPTIGQVREHGVPVPSSVLLFTPPQLNDGCWDLPVAVGGNPLRATLHYLPYFDDDSWHPIYDGLGAAYEALGERLA